MPVITFRQALHDAMDEELARDDAVILLGEEVAQYNGAYKVSQGLLDKYGPERIIDTPITEEGFTGVGIGAALVGLRPIVEWMTLNFSAQAFDQVLNNASKMLYMSGGQLKVPIVFRGPNGPAEYLASQHSQSFQAFYAHIPGLKVVAPSTPHDAKGLLKSAIRDDNPVIFLEAELMYGWKGEVPDGELLVPIGQAEVKRPGRDLTIVSFSRTMRPVLEAAEALSGEGLEAEAVDLRSLRPLDEETLYASVRRTNRCLVVDNDWLMAGYGAYLGWLVSRNCFDDLDAPVEVVGMEDVPMPYNHSLELASSLRWKRSCGPPSGSCTWTERGAHGGTGSHAGPVPDHGGRDHHPLAQEGRGSRRPGGPALRGGDRQGRHGLRVGEPGDAAGHPGPRRRAGRGWRPDRGGRQARRGRERVPNRSLDARIRIASRAGTRSATRACCPWSASGAGVPLG